VASRPDVKAQVTAHIALDAVEFGPAVRSGHGEGLLAVEVGY